MTDNRHVPAEASVLRLDDESRIINRLAKEARYCLTEVYSPYPEERTVGQMMWSVFLSVLGALWPGLDESFRWDARAIVSAAGCRPPLDQGVERIIEWRSAVDHDLAQLLRRLLTERAAGPDQ